MGIKWKQAGNFDISGLVAKNVQLGETHYKKLISVLTKY